MLIKGHDYIFVIYYSRVVEIQLARVGNSHVKYVTKYTRTTIALNSISYSRLYHVPLAYKELNIYSRVISEG